MRPFTILRGILITASLLGLSGCITIPRDFASAYDQSVAAPAEFPDSRFASTDPRIIPQLEDSVRQSLSQVGRGTFDILTLSGGGADGAFGAGVLTGWTKRGDRPEFSMVTGVSTGALIAPFAFLGPAYDDKLKEAYTSGVAASLLERRGLLTFFTPGIFSSKALAGLVDSFVDDTMIADIAREHVKGRRLVVATTNLDTQTGVIWDIGAIAQEAQIHSEKRDAARTLIRQVLAASASVPAAFAPVMIETDIPASGDIPARHFQEMHVDGSVTLPFFILPESMMNWTVPADIAVKGRVFVLINGKIDPNFIVTRQNSVTIAARSLETMTKAQARSTLIALQGFAARNRLEVSVMALPDNFVEGGMLAFDTASMREVYALGYQVGSSSSAWKADKPVN